MIDVWYNLYKDTSDRLYNYCKLIGRIQGIIISVKMGIFSNDKALENIEKILKERKENVD